MTTKSLARALPPRDSGGLIRILRDLGLSQAGATAVAQAQVVGSPEDRRRLTAILSRLTREIVVTPAPAPGQSAVVRSRAGILIDFEDDA